MRIILLHIILFLFFGAGTLNAQYYDKLHYWKKSPGEIIGGIGVGNYLGELGGGSGDARVWLLDLEFSQFKFSWQLGYRRNFSHRFAGRVSFNWVKVAGSDALTSSPTRSYRNLSFKSNIYELALYADIFILRAKPGHMYNIRGAKGMRGQPFEVFGFVGVGGFYFRSTSDGVPLAGLSTEGQGLPGGPPQYQPYSICFPFGVGVNYIYFKDFKIGLDLTYRFTLTDYIDDASTTYYDNNKLREAKGDVSADLADRSDGSNPSWTSEGSPRGNPKNKDHYLSAMVTVSYNMAAWQKKGNRPGGRHSFMKHKRRARF